MAAEQRLALLWDPDILRGGALLALGEVEQAVAAIRAGLAAREVGGWVLGRPYFMALVSEVLHQAGDRDAALTALAQAETVTDAVGERWWEAEIHRLKGMLFPGQANILETEVTTATRVAEFMFEKGLATLKGLVEQRKG